MEGFQCKGKLTATGLGMLTVYFGNGVGTAQIAKEFGLTKRTVKVWRQKWEKSGRALLTLAPRTPPEVDTQRIIDRQQRICDIICEQDETKMPKFNTLQSIAEELKNRHGIDVCKQTVANDMEAIGFNSVARRETSALKPEHIEKRLAYSTLQFPDPAKILFSDESWFMCCDGRKRQWVHESEEPVPLEVEKRIGAHVKLMVFGIIGIGVRELCFCAGTVNSETYCAMLEKTLIPLLKKYPDRIFMQDNASCHRSGATMEFLEKHDVTILSWPARSPDLNPIEHFWAIFKKTCFNKKISDVEQLRTQIVDVFAALPQSMIDNLVMSFPKRIEALKESKGGPTVNSYKSLEKIR